jgi:VanZ family protein
MSLAIPVLIVLFIGLVIGRFLEGAHDAHQHFSNHRSRSITDLGAWIRSMITAGVGVGVLILVLYLVLFALHAH